MNKPRTSAAPIVVAVLLLLVPAMVYLGTYLVLVTPNPLERKLLRGVQFVLAFGSNRSTIATGTMG
jgi:hypothetical protein